MCSAGFPEPYAFSLACPPAPAEPPRRLRHRARQPVPRHRPAHDDARRRLADARARSTTRSPSTATSSSRMRPARTGASRSTVGTASSRCRCASPRQIPRLVTVSESSKRDIVGADGRACRSTAHRSRRCRPRDLPPASRDRARPGPSDDDDELRRADEGARTVARSGREGAHRTRRRRARDHRQAEVAQRDPRAHREARVARRRAASCRGSPPNASSSCTPRPRWPSCRRSTRASRSRRSRPWPAECRSSPPPAARCPKSWANDGVSGLLVPPGDPDALAAALLRAFADAELRGADR